MDALINVNWETADMTKVVADYIDMPDGSQRIVELELLQWYWVDFMKKEDPESFPTLIAEVAEIIADDPEFDEVFDWYLRLAIMTWGKTWVQPIAPKGK